MKYLKFFESFEQNNKSGDLITEDDIIECIKRDGNVYATIIQEIPNNDPDEPLKPKDIQDDLVTIEYDNKIGYVKLDDIEKID